MSHIKITFLPSFPEALREETLAALKPSLDVLDGEVSKIVVGVEEGDDNVAAVAVHRRYHKMNLYLAMEFFTYDEEEREETILHEFSHVLVNSLTREAQRIIFSYVPDDPTKRHLSEQFEELEERVVETVAKALKEAKTR